MYAAIITLKIDPEQASAAAAAFMSDILPQLREAPGFVTGYFVDPVDGQGFGFVLFDTEDHARKATPWVIPWAAPGVTILKTDFRRVAVEIP